MTDIAFTPDVTLQWHREPVGETPGVLQIGAGRTGCVLHDVTAAEANLARLLHRPTSTARMRDLAAQRGITQERATQLAAALRRGRVVETASAVVVVAGLGAPGVACALALADAGIRDLALLDPEIVTRADLTRGGAGLRPGQLGENRARAALDVLRRHDPSLRLRVSQDVPHDATVVIATGTAALDPQVIAQVMSRDLPHLPVVLTGDGVCVGPVIRPGTDPCLRCMGLWRQELDPRWTTQVMQASTTQVPSVLTSLAVSHASAQVMAHLAGEHHGPTSVSASLPAGIPGLVQWEHHHRCGCRRDLSRPGGSAPAWSPGAAR